MQTSSPRARIRPLVLAAAVLFASTVAAAPDHACPLPREEWDEPVVQSCGFEVIGAVEVSPDGGLGQLAVHGDLGAVVQRDDGQVALLDLSDPTAPAVLGRYDGGTGQERLDHPLDGDVVFSDDGTLLFHARQTSDSSNEGLHVLDVTDPTDPTLVDHAPQGGMLRVAYATLGDTEVVVTQDAIVGLTIFTVERSPAGVRVLPRWVSALPVLKVGGPASAGLHIDPADPILGVPLLYASDGTTGLTIFDLSDLSNPAVLGSWEEQGLAEIVVHVTADARTIHAASEYWFDKATWPEIITFDASDLGDISEVTRHNPGDYEGEVAWKLGGMALAGDGLHVAHGHAGVMTLDPTTGAVIQSTTDLGEPNETALAVSMAWYAMDVLPFGDLLLATDAVTGELRVLR